MISNDNLRTVRRYLLDLNAQAGAKLPTERALAQVLELSRGAVREALSVMEAEGYVVRKIGSGTYMAPKGGSDSSGITSSLDATPRQIIEARVAFEPNIAGLAAMNGRKQDMERLKECAEAYHRANDFDSYEIADRDFHAAIAAATHNPVLISAYQAFTEAYAAAEWGGLRQRFLTKERRVESRREHDQILNAIRNRDSEGATAAARQHLQYVIAAFLKVS
ncbi:FadR/GntR family transcriptional regulator [Allopusillimonas ginsengisoli]|uniref:FadR/GntR family transcriptional regulator n=1 Tax=Allopusillimonas ginsengisoli TaxID=453575 RepID=UPI00142FFD43|nr:FCD domain-containing protein [Allopusillimonas ginsengisoli]